VRAPVWSNWAGNQRYRPQRVVSPTCAEEVAAAVTAAAAAELTVKAAGTGHSFTGVAATDGVLIRPNRLTGVRSVDRGTGLVTVESGMPLHRLCAVLAERGLALTNMGDIASQTVAGAIATGTHGTGRHSAGLAGQVRGLELVLADGSVVSCSADEAPELFEAARLGLGALGIVTAVTIQAEPAFLLRAREERLPLDEVLESFHDLAAANDHFEFFWFPHTDSAMTKLNNRTDGPAAPLPQLRGWLEDEFLGNTGYGLVLRAGRAAPRLIPALNAVCVRGMGSREYSDRSDRVFTTPRRFRFVEMEYAVPRTAAVPALRELRTLITRSNWYLSMPVEVRIAPSDDIWLSTASGRDTAYIAVHTYRRMPHEDFFAAVEPLMVSYAGRPHWAKLHTRDAGQMAEAYPKMGDFIAVRDKVDPTRRFANDYLRQVLGD
jgi:L-gulono-1,4-lactone dehydrogenase